MPRQTPFVARDREVRILEGRLAEAARGAGGLVFVSGAPGMGKTRLANEFARRARQAGWLVLSGQCVEIEGGPPYLPFTQALRSYVEDCPAERLIAELGEGAEDVALLVREVRTKTSAPLAAPPAERDRYQLFESLSDFLIAIARDSSHGLLLVIDDLHWADKSTLLLLLHLARRVLDKRILILCTHRDTEAGCDDAFGHVLAEASRERLSDTLTLTAFDAAQALMLVRLQTDGPVAPEVANAICRRAAGTPFYIEEITRHLASAGRDLSDPASAEEDSGIPEGVRRVLGRRLDRLSPACARLLRTGAVLGESFPYWLLRATSEDEVGVLEALEEALAAGVLVEEEDRYRFAHSLFRETIYRDLSTPRRNLLHKRAAQAIEGIDELPGPLLGALAYHCFEAGAEADPQRTVLYARQAGDYALQMLGFEESAGLYTIALRCLERVEAPDVEQRCQLLLTLGDTLRRAGDLAAAMHSYQQAAGLARSLGAHELFANAALGYEDALFSAGTPRLAQDDPSQVMLSEAALSFPEGDSPLLATVLARLARALYFGQERPRARSLSEQALLMAKRTGDPAANAHALYGRLIVISGPNDIEEQIRVATDLTELASRAADLELELAGRARRILHALTAGATSEYDVELGAFAVSAEKLRQNGPLARLAYFQALRALLDGRFVEAERLSADGFALGKREQDQEIATAYHVQRLAVRRATGSVESIDEACKSMEELRFAPYPFYGAVVAVARYEAGRIEDAHQAFEVFASTDFGVLPQGVLWLPHATMLAETCAGLGDAARASTLYELLLPYAGYQAGYVEYQGSVSRYLGLLAVLLRRWDAAERHFVMALESNSSASAWPWVAYCRHDFAAALLARGRPEDRSRALAMRDAALHAARRMGMAPLIRRIGARGSGPEPVGKPPDRDGLSDRETEVLRLLARGHTNREIGEQLVISARTVEHHVERIYEKIGARRRTDAAAYALRKGIVSRDA
jgi:DNA-binding CsgD family transcriptional regulator